MAQSQDCVKSKRVEQLLNCPICWESFNLVENMPYVLWCGHTICKSCILALQWASVKIQAYPIQLPLFVSCPWCQGLSFRLVWKAKLKFPCKNYFLLWLVESANDDPMRNLFPSYSDRRASFLEEFPDHQNESRVPAVGRRGHSILDCGGQWRLQALIRKLTLLLLNVTAKFPVVLIFLLIVLYIIPASFVVLALYLLITFLFAFPSFLVLYFSYPMTGWLLREIAS